MQMPRSFASLLAGLSILCVSAASRADAYDDGLARAKALAAQGDLAGASQALAPLVDSYPQDWVIAAEFAAIEYQRNNFAVAAQAYRVALSRAPSATLAERGLGWAELRLGHCEEAKLRFDNVLRSAPDDASARDGLAACAHAPAAAPTLASAPPEAMQTPIGGTVSAGLHQSIFAGHPWKTSATGLDVSASALLYGHLWVAGAYEYTRTTATAAAGTGDYDHLGAYAHVGWVSRPFDAILQGGLLFDPTGAVGDSKHAGLSLRFSVLGDLFLNASVSSYNSMTVGRFEPSWRIPLGSWLRVVPSFALESAGSETLPSGALALAAETGFGSFWLSGKYGEQVRPAYLSQFVVYDTADRVLWGLGAGARVPILKWLGAYGSYSFDRQKTVGTTASVESDAHVFSIGPYLSF